MSEHEFYMHPYLYERIKQITAQVEELQRWVAGLNTRLGKMEMKLEDLLRALEHSRLGLKLIDDPEEVSTNEC